MVPKLLALFWLFLLPVLSAEPAPDPPLTLDSLFVIKKDTDDASGYKSRYSSLESYLVDARTLVEAGPQAIEDAQDLSTRESKMAKQYLYTYFRANDVPSIDCVEGERNHPAASPLQIRLTVEGVKPIK